MAKMLYVEVCNEILFSHGVIDYQWVVRGKLPIYCSSFGGAYEEKGELLETQCLVILLRRSSLTRPALCFS
jgi:hypothetical protein